MPFFRPIDSKQLLCKRKLVLHKLDLFLLMRIFHLKHTKAVSKTGIGLLQLFVFGGDLYTLYSALITSVFEFEKRPKLRSKRLIHKYFVELQAHSAGNSFHSLHAGIVGLA